MIQSVGGAITTEQAGVILPHEHVLVAFIEDGRLTLEDYDRADVEERILPFLLELKEAGCDTFVDASPMYLGRDPYVLKALSERSGLHIVTNTGLYKAPYLPPFVYEAGTRELADAWIREAREGIADSGVKPGFVKIAFNPGRLLPVQEKILRAAIRTSLETGLPVQAHTHDGVSVMHAIEIMEETGFPGERFIWVHAQSESDEERFRRAYDRGIWIEIDCICRKPHEDNCRMIAGLLGLGFGDRLLLSQDLGWYTVGQERGGELRPYHRLFTEFLPYARQYGLPEETLRRLTTSAPAEAMRIRAS